MNKSELIDEIRSISGDECSKASAERALEIVLDAIMKWVKRDGNVQLIGFGTFSVSERAPRMGINPKTKASIRIPASRTVKFKVGSKFKEMVVGK